MKTALLILILCGATILKAHPEKLSLYELVNYSDILVSGKLLSVNDYSYILVVDDIYFGLIKSDTIEIIDNGYDKLRTNRVKNDYKPDDIKLVFIKINECGKEVIYYNSGLFLEGEIEVDSNKVSYQDSLYFLSDFTNTIVKYRTTRDLNEQYFLNESIYKSFKSSAILYDFYKTDSLLYANELKKQGYRYIGSPVVSFNKMNVMYLGLENPIQVAFENYTSEEMEVLTSNGRIIKHLNGHYTVVPESVSNLSYITICSKNKSNRQDTLGRIRYRVKQVPDPVVKIAGRKSGVIQKNLLLSQRGVNCDIEKFDFEISFKIISFSLKVSNGNEIMDACSFVFTEEMKELIRNAESGDIVKIFDVVVIGQDGITRTLDPLEIEIK